MITDLMLSAACAEIVEAIVMDVPDNSAITYQFSPEFERKMKKIIRRGNHPVRYRVLQYAASFALVILLSFFTLMAVSPSARAAVAEWVRNTYSYYTHYFYAGEKKKEFADINYVPTYIPQGYRETQNINGMYFKSIHYGKEGTKDTIYFMYSKDPNAIEFFYEIDDYIIDNVIVNSQPGEFLHPKNSDIANIIQWIDEETDMLLTISGHLDKNELLKIAENVKK